MANITLNKDMELIYEDTKATDYLWDIIKELVERTGGEFMPDKKYVSVAVVPPTASDFTVYTAPSNIQHAIIDKASVTNLTAGNIAVNVGISTDAILVGADLVYNAVAVGPNETFELTAMEGLFVQNTERILVFGSDTCSYHFSITELS